MRISTRVYTLSNKITIFLKFIPIKTYLLLVLVFALVIRLWGVWHGLPYIYSVDEPALVHSVLGLRFDLNPHHFDWPHFHFYLSYLVFGIFYKARIAWQVWGWKPAMEAMAPILWNDGAVFYLLLRLLSLFMGALTVIPVYLASKEILISPKKALLAALVFALIPFHVENSKYALIDVPATFWCAWSLWFALKTARRPSLLNYILAGLFGGLAMSTKYNGLLIILVLVLVHLSRLPFVETFISLIKRKWRNIDIGGLLKDWWKLVLAGVTALAAFFAGTPYALLDWKEFSRSDTSIGAFWQLTRSGNRLELAVFGRLADALFNKILSGYGFIPLIISLVGLFFVFRRGNKLQRVTGLFFVFFTLYVGSSVFAPIQIFMPLFLVLPSLFILGLFPITDFIKKEFFENNKAWRVAYPLLVITAVTPLVAASLKVDYLYTFLDTRNIAKNFIDYAIPKGKVIGVEGEYQPFYEGTHPVIGVQAWRYDPLSQKKIEYVVVSGDMDLRGIRENSKFGGILENLYPIYSYQNFGDRLGPNLFIYKLNYPLNNQWWLNESKLPKLSVDYLTADNHEWRESILPADLTYTVAVTGTWDFSGKTSEIMKTRSDYSYPVSKVGGHLHGLDLAVADLLYPFKQDCSDFTVCTNSEAVKSLTESGIDVVNLPVDPSFAETKTDLTAAKIQYSDGQNISYSDVKNNHLAFVSINPASPDFTQATISASIKTAKDNKADVIFVNFNWLKSQSPSKELAHLAIDSGATVVTGESSSVNGVEFYNEHFISYGGGQFVSSATSPVDLQGRVGPGVTYELYFFGNRLVDIDFGLNYSGTYDIYSGSSCQVFGEENKNVRLKVLQQISIESAAYIK
ncbi:MAG: phospholipid carrier-dependent glycosyltransferase [candidate division WWE3 bacterium]|nr:phospholipid carrier-dependent glycosyltransferase [candidate division WWE3 bacterium]